MRTHIFFVKSREILYCPHCMMPLKHRDWKLRICKRDGGEKDFIQVERMKCEHCNRLHTALPNTLTPFKHYETDVISGVLDDLITTDDLDDENYPCEVTMNRWHHWLMANHLYINGKLKSDGYSKFGFSEALLLSEISLLDELRLRCQDWLETIQHFIYNLGGFLVPA